MQRCSRLLVVLVLASLLLASSDAASVMQLDVCNKHKSVSQVPAHSLTVKDGLCIVSNMVMAQPDRSSSGSSSTQSQTCGVAEGDGAIVFKFPCAEKERAAVSKTYGPALNLWTSMDADTKPAQAAAPATGKTKPAIITEKAAVKFAQTTGQQNKPNNQQQKPSEQHLRQPAPATTAPIPTGTCSFTTMNPGIYFHRAPPMYVYGYSVSGVPCDSITAAQLASSTEEAANSVRTAGTGVSQFSSSYGLWLLPTLPGPPKDFSEEDQTCFIVMSVASRSYQSLSKYPCKMSPVPNDQLGNGCCYNPARKFRRSLFFSFGSGVSVSH